MTTREVTDSLERTVAISSKPERVIALQDWAGGLSLMSIGAPLVGMVTRDGSFMPQVARQFDLAGVEQVGEGGEWSLEKIAALKPDLIVGSAWEGKPNVENYDVSRLQAIAPTYFIEDGQTTLNEYMTTIGTITGLDAEVNRQRDAWNAVSAQAKHDLAAQTAGLSYALVGWFSPTYYVATPANPSPLIKVGTEIGLSLPAAAAKRGAARSDFLELSEERLDEAPTDVLYWSTSYGDPTKLKLWSRQPAVRAKQAYELELSPIGWSYHEYTRTLEILQDTIPGSKASVVAD